MKISLVNRNTIGNINEASTLTDINNDSILYLKIIFYVKIYNKW